MKRYLIAAACAVTLAARVSPAHEGHQPLPTKGLQVDLEAGRISLSRAARDALDVQTAEVDRQQVADHVTAYATVVAPWTQHAFVTSRLPGRIVRLDVLPGDTVAAGTVLAELQSLELENLRFDLRKAQNDLDLSAQVLAGLAPAAKAGAVPGQRLIEAETTHLQNENAVAVLRAKAAALGIPAGDLQRAVDSDSARFTLPLVSPISGVVVHADVAVGKVIEPTEHLFEIVDTSRVWVQIGVLERDLHAIGAGQTARFSFAGLSGHGRAAAVDKVVPLLDPTTHQGTAWVELSNAEGEPPLLPGMSGQAELSQPSAKPVLTVPREAIFSDGAERYVLVEESATKEGSEYQKVAVVAGRTTGDRVEILAGQVLPGDRVVTRGGHELSSLFVLGVLRVSPETARGMRLQVEPVSEQIVERVLPLDGAVDISPQRRTFASSQLAGTIREISIDRAQRVRAGDVLAQVASLELQDLELELLQAHFDAKMWRETYERRRMIGDAIPRRTVLETESRAKSYEMQAAGLRQKLLTLGLTSAQIDNVVETGTILHSIPVRAPIDGVVVHFDRALGQLVRADEPLFEIHDLSAPMIKAYVGERESALVRPGQPARVRLVAFPGFVGEGTVTRLGPTVGPESRTRVIWIELSETPPFSLLHNMLARVTLTTERSGPTPAVPLTAVVREGLRNFVFVQQDDGTFERRPIETGRADDRFVEVISGLSPGEQIVTQGVTDLQTAYASVR